MQLSYRLNQRKFTPIVAIFFSAPFHTSPIFKDGPTPVFFSFIFVFSYRKLVVSRIRTRIIRVEGEDADH